MSENLDSPPATEAIASPKISLDEIKIMMGDLFRENNRDIQEKLSHMFGIFQDHNDKQLDSFKKDVSQNIARLDAESQENKNLGSQFSREFTEHLRSLAQNNRNVSQSNEEYFTPDQSVGFPDDGAGLTHDLRFAGHYSSSPSPPHNMGTSQAHTSRLNERRQTDFIRQSTETRESSVRPPDTQSTTIYSVALEKFSLVLEAPERTKPCSVQQFAHFSKSFAKYKTDNPGAQPVDLTQKMGPWLQAQIRENAFPNFEMTITQYNGLSNEQILDAVRLLVLPKTPTQFLNMFRELVQFPVLRGVESVVNQDIVSSGITAFMNQAAEMFDYLSDANAKNVPNLVTKGKQIGLLEGWFYPALAELGIPFERYFTEAKEEHLHNDFHKFREQVKQINIANKANASLAVRMQKANAAYAKRFSSTPPPSPAVFSVPPRSQDARQFPPASLHNIDEVEDSLASLSTFQEEPPNKGCFFQIFFDAQCTRKGCMFDHSKDNTLRWRIFYANQLDYYMNPHSTLRTKSTVTPAGAPRPSTMNNMDLLYAPPGIIPGIEVPTRSSLTEEGREVYDRLRKRQAEEMVQRRGFHEALYLHGLTNSQAASAAHEYNNRKDANHNVKQNAAYFSAGDSDDEYSFTYNDPVRGKMVSDAASALK